MTVFADLDMAIIGGTGLYRLADLQAVESHQPVTRYGAPSGPIHIGLLAGKRVAFLARHGDGHSVPPHRINYRANLAALKAVGGDMAGKTDQFRAALRKADFKSVRGKFRFANNQHPVQDWFLLRIEPDASGKLAYRTIKPIAPDHGDPHARNCPL